MKKKKEEEEEPREEQHPYRLNLFENNYEVEILISNSKIIVELDKMDISKLKRFYKSLKVDGSAKKWILCRDEDDGEVVCWFVRKGAFIQYCMIHDGDGLYSSIELNLPLNSTTKRLFADLIYIYDHMIL